MGLISSAYDAYKINKEYSRKWEPKEQPKMTCRCTKCDINFASINDYQKHKCEKEFKMTREEAELIVRTTLASNNAGFVTVLEKLGLLKFDEPKEARVVFEINLITGDVTDNAYKYGQELVNQYGTIRLELWPEGLVLWVGGEIRWRSWLDKRPDEVNPV